MKINLKNTIKSEKKKKKESGLRRRSCTQTKCPFTPEKPETSSLVSINSLLKLTHLLSLCLLVFLFCVSEFMAASLLSPLTVPNPETVGPNIGASKSSFLSSTKLFLLTKPHPRKPTAQRCYKSPFAKSIDHIPKQFRQQNLKDGCQFLHSYLYLLPIPFFPTFLLVLVFFFFSS